MTEYSGFSAALVGDLNNNLQDLSAYIFKAEIPEDFGMVDVTPLVAGGGQPTTKQIHGATKSNVRLSVFSDPTPRLVAEQIIGLRAGSTIQLKLGVNASPTIGGKTFQGTFTLFGVQPTRETNDRPASEIWDLEPADVGTTGITPGWYQL